MSDEIYDGPCRWCGENCEPWAGNPGRWPMVWTNPDRTGITFYIHIGCLQKFIIEKDKRIEELEKEIEELKEEMSWMGP
jgi:hypothetical protein